MCIRDRYKLGYNLVITKAQQNLLLPTKTNFNGYNDVKKHNTENKDLERYAVIVTLHINLLYVYVSTMQAKDLIYPYNVVCYPLFRFLRYILPTTCFFPSLEFHDSVLYYTFSTPYSFTQFETSTIFSFFLIIIMALMRTTEAA